MQKLRYAGFQGDRFDDLNLEGYKIICECSESEYNNQPSEQWDLALPPREHRFHSSMTTR